MPKKRRKLKSFVYLLYNKRGTTKNTTFFNFNHFLIAIKRKKPIRCDIAWVFCVHICCLLIYAPY